MSPDDDDDVTNSDSLAHTFLGSELNHTDNNVSVHCYQLGMCLGAGSAMN